MKLQVSLLLRGLLPAVCSAALVPRTAAQGTDMGSLLGLSSTRMLEIEDRYRSAELSGEWKAGMKELALLARTARESGDRPAWVAAELAWVKLASHENEPDELEDALQELATRARDWNMARQEADVYAYWAELREDQGDWLSAVKAHDCVVQVALGDGMISRAVTALLEMSRICRENEHPWRLQQVWLRIAQVENEFAASLDADAKAALAAERVLVQPMVGTLVPQKIRTPKVDLQPEATAVKVSAPQQEVGRTRFMLTNESVRTVKGTLRATPKTGTVKGWESGASGQWITLAPAKKDAAAGISDRQLSLRPGERVSVYVEREMPAKEDTVNLSWTGENGGTQAVGQFLFAANEPLSSFTTGGGVYSVRPGWGVPFYHEMNYRGSGVRVEDFQFQASVPCRLEIYDIDAGRHPSVDAGTLLAVDAEGDGLFDGPNDLLNSDLNQDAVPDILISDRTRSLEVYAWPLVPLAEGDAVTVTARLRRPGDPNSWRTDAENSLVPTPAAVEEKPAIRTWKANGESASSR